jgi:hypothetical protein
MLSLNIFSIQLLEPPSIIFLLKKEVLSYTQLSLKIAIIVIDSMKFNL